MAPGTKLQGAAPKAAARGNRRPSPLQRKPPPARGASENAFHKIMKAVSDGIVRTAHGTGPAALSRLESLGAVVRGAVRGASGVAPNSVVGVKAIVMGVMRGTDARGDAAIEVLSQTARVILRQTSEMNGDVAAAALGLMLGALTSARWMGVYPPMAASAARTAALDEAAGIGPVAAEKVRDVLKQDVDGVAALSSSSFQV